MAELLLRLACVPECQLTAEQLWRLAGSSRVTTYGVGITVAGREFQSDNK